MLVLPPVNDGNPASFNRSPYLVSLQSLVDRFATSPQRCSVLAGFLRFRRELHDAGLKTGFQWLDGSFVENVESLEGRPPRDLDVVTFVEGGVTDFASVASSTLLSPAWVKSRFHVDHYWVNPTRSGRDLVRLSTYWYSVWSHRQDGQWKGFLQVDLCPVDDVAADNMLRYALAELDSGSRSFPT